MIGSPASASADATERRLRRRLTFFSCLLMSLPLFGCAVPQPRGEGKLERVVEPTSRRGYWLYLPKSYIETPEPQRASRRWPLVVTFHGMKPFDGSHSQACEWQQEADRYGFVVIAPELKAPDVFQQFPVRTVHKAFKSDEDATLAILDHVFQTTDADPGNVLSTSWSSGGYMAHYMLNRHPDRFTCVAVRQSNFSASVLDPQRARESLYHPVLILNTQNDFAVCKKESRQAVEWYQTHGYKNMAWVYIKNLGHERTPDIAADFFGRVSGVQPNRPPAVLVERQAIDGNAEGIALLTGNFSRVRAPTAGEFASRGGGNPTPPRVRRDAVRPAARPAMSSAAPARQESPSSGFAATPPRGAATPDARSAPRLLTIRATPRTGIEPLYLNFSAECPPSWHRTADFLWTMNGETIGHGINGQKTVAEPGDHTLGLLVVTSDGQEYRAYQTIRVIPRITAGAVSSP